VAFGPVATIDAHEQIEPVAREAFAGFGVRLIDARISRDISAGTFESTR